MNIIDKAERVTTRTRTRQGQTESYYLICLEEKDYIEFKLEFGEKYAGQGFNRFLLILNELGFDIRLKGEN